MYPHFHNAFEYNVDAVIAAVENKEIVLPDKIIYIKLIDEKTFITRSKRGVSVPLFSEFSSLKYLELYYLKILNIFYPNKNIVIHSKNGLINRMKLALSAQKFGKENSDFQNEYIDPKKLYLL